MQLNGQEKHKYQRPALYALETSYVTNLACNKPQLSHLSYVVSTMSDSHKLKSINLLMDFLFFILFFLLFFYFFVKFEIKMIVLCDDEHVKGLKRYQMFVIVAYIYLINLHLDICRQVS